MFRNSKSQKLVSFSFVLTLLFSISSQAQVSIIEKVVQTYMASPLYLVPAVANQVTPPQGHINLLGWNVSPQDPPQPTEHYNRLHHFGEWIVIQQAPQDCTDTRNKVLIRDSESPVQMRTSNPCKVASGEWNDPYTAQTYKSSKEVQIDHVVPLKNAYTNGAWRWNYQTRCLYANFLGYRDHLLAVDGPANMAKGDGGPDEYMPPNPAFKCEYLKIFLSIKLIWRLGMSRAEAQGIQNLIAQEHCDTQAFTFSTAELQQVREYIQSNLNLCSENPPDYTQHDSSQSH